VLIKAIVPNLPPNPANISKEKLYIIPDNAPPKIINGIVHIEVLVIPTNDPAKIIKGRCVEFVK
jgi:hypothetical protein